MLCMLPVALQQQPPLTVLVLALRPTCAPMEAHTHRVELQRNARLSLSSSQQAQLRQQCEQQRRTLSCDRQPVV